MQERFRKERYRPMGGNKKNSVELKFPWEEETPVIKAQASSLDALTRAIARHQTDYNPADSLGGEMFIDPAVFSDEEIKVALGLPEKFNVTNFRTNPALLDEIPNAYERLRSYGVDLFAKQMRDTGVDVSDEDRAWWKEAASDIHRYSTGPALEGLGWAWEKVEAGFFYPARSWEGLIKEAEALDAMQEESLELLAEQVKVRPDAFPEGYLEAELAKQEYKLLPGYPILQNKRAEVRYLLGKLADGIGGVGVDMMLGDDAPEDIKRFQDRMAPFIKSMQESENFPVFGDAAAWATAALTSIPGAHLDPDTGGTRFATPENWGGSMAMAFVGLEGHKEFDYKFYRDVTKYMEQGATRQEARLQAFMEREDISQKTKVATSLLSNATSYAGLPPVWKVAKLPGKLYDGTVQGIRYSNQIAGRVPRQPFRAFKGGLPTEEEALARLNTNKSMVGGLVNRIPGSERIFGVANQIQRWRPGDIRRTVSESIGWAGIMDDAIANIMSQTMQGFRAFGDFKLVQPGKQLRRRLLKPWETELRSGLEIVNDLKSPLHLTFAPGRVFRKWRVVRPTAESIRAKARTMFTTFRSAEPVEIGKQNRFTMRFIDEYAGDPETAAWWRSPEGQQQLEEMIASGAIKSPEEAVGYGDTWTENYEVVSKDGTETWLIEVSTDPIESGAGVSLGANEAVLNIYRQTVNPTTGFAYGTSSKGLKTGMGIDVLRDALGLVARSERLKGINKLVGTRMTDEYVLAREQAVSAKTGKPMFFQPMKDAEFNVSELLKRVDLPTETRATEELTEAAKLRQPDPVYWRDVFERPGDFIGLTDKELALIKDIQGWYKAIRQYAISEGVNIKELGSLEEGFSFVSAKVKGFKLGKEGKDAQKEYVSLAEARPKPTAETTRRTDFRKSRLYQTMEESVQKSGTDYYSPFETIEAYGRSVLNEVKVARLQRKLAPHLRGTEVKTVYPELYKAKQVAGKGVKRQRDLIKMVNQFKANLIPHTSQINSLKRWFPELVEQIDEVLGYTKDRWMTAVRDMNAMAKAGTFPKQVIEALQEMHFQTNLPKHIGRKDVHKALKAAGLEDKQHRAMVTQVMNMIGKGFKEDRAVAVNKLIGDMKGLQPELQDHLTELQKAMGHKSDLQRVPLLGERESAAFRGYIWTGDRAEWAWSKTEAFMAPANKWYDTYILPFNSILRSFKTVADFGSPITHGLPLLFNDPKKWAFATTMHFRAFGDDAVKARYLADNGEDVSIFLKHGMHLGSTEITEAARESGTLARLAWRVQRATEKMPVVGRDTPFTNKIRSGLNAPTKIIELGGRRFSSSFEGFLDIARIEIMKGLKETAMNSKNPERAMTELAEYANKMTGVTSTRALGVPVGQRALESAALFFSPRYTRAIASLYMDMTRGGLKGELARSSLAHLFMGQIALHAAVSAMLDQEMNLIPGPGFLKNNILGDEESPGMMIGTGGKANSIANMLGDVITQSFDNPEGFLHVNVFSQKTYDENSALKRMRYMESPLLQEVTSWWTGADAIGRRMPDPTDIAEILPYVATRFSPFAIEAAVEAGLNSQGASSFLVETTGGMTSPVSAYKKRDDLRDKFTLEDYGPEGKVEALNLRTYEELKAYHRHKSLLAGMERRHEELLEWTNKAEKQSEEYVRNDEKVEIAKKLDLIRTEAVNGVTNAQGAVTSKGYNQIGEELEKSPHERAGFNFQQEFWRINKAETARKREVELSHKSFYADRAMYFEDTEPANLAMAAAEDFMDFYLSPRARDEFGSLNHAAVDRKIEDIERGMRISLVAEGMSEEEATEMAKQVTLENEKQYLERFLKTPEGIELHPNVVQFIQGFPLVDEFHSAYQTALPEEQHTKYKVFIGSSWAVKQQLLTQPEYKRMSYLVGLEQDKMRRNNYELDVHMVKFYDMAPVNQEHKREIHLIQRKEMEKLR